MRKANREIEDRDGILAVLEASDVCRIGLYAGGEVYIVPMNFGFDFTEDGTLTLYFHCASEGRKLDMIAKNPNVCFEMDTDHKLIPAKDGTACDFSMNYASIIGSGLIETVDGNDEKINALIRIMQHYSDAASFHFNENMLGQTTVLRLIANSYTGKRLSCQAEE